MIDSDIPEVDEKNSKILFSIYLIKLQGNFNRNEDLERAGTDAHLQLSQAPSSTTKQSEYEKKKELIKKLLERKNNKKREPPS